MNYIEYTNVIGCESSEFQDEIRFNILNNPSITELILHNCDIENIPNLLETQLTSISVVNCSNLCRLPLLPNTLKMLDISYTNISELPNIPTNLEIFEWSNCNNFNMPVEFMNKFASKIPNTHKRSRNN
jgi:hypothetical protein